MRVFMNIELKQWNQDNKKELVKICNEADRTFLANRLPKPYTEQNAEWWLGMVEKEEGKKGIFRAIVADGEYIGNISAEMKEDVYSKDAEIGYLLLTPMWSKGVMTEAVKQMCSLAFEQLDVIRLTGLVYEPNTASRRVLEKNSFILEGIMKQAVYKNGNIYNLCIYGKYKSL